MITGVLISAFVFGGTPKRAVKKAFTETFIYVSPAILKEYRETPLLLEAKGKIDHSQLKALISGIASFVSKAKLIQSKKILICRDPEDKVLIECCLEARADFLVTGDKDLLDIRELPFKLDILSPAQFVSRLKP